MKEKKNYNSPEMVLEEISIIDSILTSGVVEFDETNREIWNF